MKQTYNNKTVVVTGHTGFKGSWLTAWLKYLGASVVGIALDPPTKPSHYIAANIDNGIIDHREDIRNHGRIVEIIDDVQPDFVFHMAAQPLVVESYADPVTTWETNVLGTINILEALRRVRKACSAVIITSDKCYDNVEWEWGYRESDSLGGPDPYSASKGAAELAIKSYVKSYFHDLNSHVRVASARAGNVIGGGDWAKNRIIPDCVQNWSKGRSVELRNPHSTRPWQHVLEPLGGYLSLACHLSRKVNLNGQAFNFGPPAHQNNSVLALVKQMSCTWSDVNWDLVEQEQTNYHEAGLLKLNCDKALHLLNWHAILNFEETVALTSEWYRAYYEDPHLIKEITRSQIDFYSKRMHS